MADPTPLGRSRLRAERAQRRSLRDRAGDYGSGGGAQRKRGAAGWPRAWRRWAWGRSGREWGLR